MDEITKNRNDTTRILFWFCSSLMLSFIFLYLDNYAFFYGELSRGQVVGRDYLNAWTAINLAMDGKYEDIFFPDKFINHAPLNIQSTNVVAYFSYPPQYLLFLIPFSFFTYKISLILWTLTNLMVFYISIRCAFDFSKRNLFIMIFSPVVILNISFGQNGILTGSLFILAVSFIHNKPILSGIFFGLLTIKPHLGVIIPFALFFGGYWRVFISATATTLALMVLISVLFSVDIWDAWVHSGILEISKDFIEYGKGAGIMNQISTFASARYWINNINIAWLLQSIVSLYAIYISCLLFKTSKDKIVLSSILICSSYLFSPYMHSYDLTALTVIAFLWIVKYRELELNSTELYLCIFVWLMPLLVFPMYLVGLPIVPIAVFFFSIVIILKEKNL